MENNRPLGWTTLDEAKKLVEAGLDTNTADMGYELETQSPRATSFTQLEKYFKALYVSPIYEPMTKAYPCWSLGALIGILPYKIKYEQDTYRVLGTKNHVSYPRLTTLWPELYSKDGNNTIECVVNMIIILLEDGYIKKTEEHGE